MKLTLPDQLTILNERYTQRELAKKFRVSDRTIRRWKNENGAPSAAHRKTQARIAKASSATRRELLAQGRSKVQDFKIPVSVRVPPKLHRITRIDPRDPKRRRRILSDTLDADVSRLRPFDIYALLVAYRDKANRERRRAGFRLMVRMAEQFESGGMVRPAGGRTMTRWEEFNDWEDDEIAEYLSEIDERGKILGARLLDPIVPVKRRGAAPAAKARAKSGAKRGAKKQAGKSKRSRK